MGLFIIFTFSLLNELISPGDYRDNVVFFFFLSGGGGGSPTTHGPCGCRVHAFVVWGHQGMSLAIEIDHVVQLGIPGPDDAGKDRTAGGSIRNATGVVFAIVEADGGAADSRAGREAKRVAFACGGAFAIGRGGIISGVGGRGFVPGGRGWIVGPGVVSGIKAVARDIEEKESLGEHHMSESPRIVCPGGVGAVAVAAAEIHEHAVQLCLRGVLTNECGGSILDEQGVLIEVPGSLNNINDAVGEFLTVGKDGAIGSHDQILLCADVAIYPVFTFLTALHVVHAPSFGHLTLFVRQIPQVLVGGVEHGIGAHLRFRQDGVARSRSDIAHADCADSNDADAQKDYAEPTEDVF